MKQFICFRNYVVKRRVLWNEIYSKFNAIPILRYNTTGPAMPIQAAMQPKSRPINHASIFAGAHLFKISAAPFFVSASTISSISQEGNYDSGINPHKDQYTRLLQVDVVKVNTLRLRTPISVSQDLNIKSLISPHERL